MFQKNGMVTHKEGTLHETKYITSLGFQLLEAQALPLPLIGSCGDVLYELFSRDPSSLCVICYVASTAGMCGLRDFFIWI